MNLKPLIFDRTYTDVQYARNNPNSSEDLKGALNISDLNRLEEWCLYFKDILSEYGDTSNVVNNYISSSKTYTELNLQSNIYNAYINNKYYILCKYQGAWKLGYYLCWYNQFNNFINNVNIFNNIFIKYITTGDIQSNSTPNYLLVNNIENILYNINIIQKNIKYIPRCGTFFCGENSIYY